MEIKELLQDHTASKWQKKQFISPGNRKFKDLLLSCLVGNLSHSYRDTQLTIAYTKYLLDISKACPFCCWVSCLLVISFAQYNTLLRLESDYSHLKALLWSEVSYNSLEQNILWGRIRWKKWSDMWPFVYGTQKINKWDSNVLYSLSFSWIKRFRGRGKY